jgi:hypothetical protein
MKKRFLFWACSSIYFFPAKAQVVLAAGNNFVQTGGYVVLQDVNLVNNGSFNPAGGSVRFSGSGNNSIGGSTSPAFNILEINKSTGNQLSLQNNISVNSYIDFLSGLIELSGNNIVLNNTAYLNNESETSRITGATGGYVQATGTLNAPSSANPGNLGAVISTAENAGVTVIRRGHVSQQNAYGGGNSIYRYYDIVPATVPSLFTLHFNYFDAELNGLDELNLAITKSNNNTLWLMQGFTSRDASANYVEFDGITNFNQRYTLSTINNVLPIELLSFGTNCRTNAVDIKWTTAGQMSSDKFEVQRSSDGRQWQSIGTVTASSGDQYVYTDPSAITGAMYRLKITTDDNITYSAIRSSGCALATNAFIYPNPATTNFLKVQLNNMPDKEMVLMLYSNSGQLLQVKNITLAGTFETYILPITDLPAGQYHLSILSPGYKKTFAFVKQ